MIDLFSPLRKIQSWFSDASGVSFSDPIGAEIEEVNICGLGGGLDCWTLVHNTPDVFGFHIKIGLR